MQSRNDTLICLADAQHGRLLRCSVSDRGQCRPVELGRYERSGADTLDSRVRRDQRITTRDRFDSARSEHDRRYAKDIMAWLSDRINGSGPRKLVLMAAPKLLSALGRHCPKRLRTRAKLVPCDLAQLDVTSLAEHPTVLEAVGIHP